MSSEHIELAQSRTLGDLRNPPYLFFRTPGEKVFLEYTYQYTNDSGETITLDGQVPGWKWDENSLIEDEVGMAEILAQVLFYVQSDGDIETIAEVSEDFEDYLLFSEENLR